MKKNILSLALVAMIAGAGCSSDDKVERKEEKVAEAKKELSEAKAEARQEKAENAPVVETKSAYDTDRERMIKRIEENERQIAELKARAAKEKKSEQDKYNRKIERIEKKNQQLEEDLAKYDNKDETRWTNFKEEFNHDMDELGDEIKDVFTDNK